ncbi:hypothetical protein GOBAR_DD08036 [Gossypium barbadense]|nr:hypothetical protein GOBAR_DD08036 [Gossypium barbadense]
MEEGDAKNPNTEQMEVKEPKHDGTTMRKALLVINCIMLSIGNCGSPLIMRLYFIHGGNQIWFSSWLQTAGCPIILLPITCAYVHRSRTANPTSENKLFCMERPLFVAAIVLGILSGLDNYLYSYGLSRLPVSTSSLIIASQLAFTAGFAFLLVKQKFTAYSYKKAKQEISYALVMEIQLVMCLVATGFCTVGMLVNNDFKVIGREAREFELGETKYHVVVVFSAIINQCFFLGAIGVVFCASSLLSAVVIAVLLPVTEILAVFFFNEKFQAEKGVSLALSLWGFISYFYGEIKQSKKKKPDPETEMASSLLPNTLKSSV